MTAQRQVTSGAAGEPACRPGSVHQPKLADGHPSRAAVASSLVRSTREHRAGRPQALAQAQRPKPQGPSDLAPGGVYLAARITPGAGGLLHHRFTLTAPALASCGGGGLFSVALSRGSPRVGATDHPALRSPDFPRPLHAGSAIARPTRPSIQGRTRSTSAKCRPIGVEDPHNADVGRIQLVTPSGPPTTGETLTLPSHGAITAASSTVVVSSGGVMLSNDASGQAVAGSALPVGTSE